MREHHDSYEDGSSAAYNDYNDHSVPNDSNNHAPRFPTDFPPISQVHRQPHQGNLPNQPPRTLAASQPIRPGSSAAGHEKTNQAEKAEKAAPTKYGASGLPTHQLNQALRESVRSRPLSEQLGDIGTLLDALPQHPHAPHVPHAPHASHPQPVQPVHTPGPTSRLMSVAPARGGMTEDFEAFADDEIDRPTNVYHIAQYQYQISINALSMAESELAILLPHSGRVIFNARLFSDVPRNRELTTRDAWWRVIDASPAVRFLLGWCISFYHTAHFEGVAPAQLPPWQRKLHFGPVMSQPPRETLQLMSDVICEVTQLFTPVSRIWQQVQAVVPEIRRDDRQWRVQLQRSHHNIEDMLRYLAERNNCPTTLVQRALDGNQRLTTPDGYTRFTEAIMHDLPRLQIQRSIAIQEATAFNPQNSRSAAGMRFPGTGQQQRFSAISDPRKQPAFWQLYL